MPRGGRRPGAGRPKGSTTRRALALVEQAEQERQYAPPPPQGDDITPLEIMMDNIRWYRGPAVEAIKQILDPTANADERKLRLQIFMEERSIRGALQNAAKDAAPYLHRRLFGDKPMDQEPAKRPIALIVEEEKTL